MMIIFIVFLCIFIYSLIMMVYVVKTYRIDHHEYLSHFPVRFRTSQLYRWNGKSQEYTRQTRS